MQNSTAFFPSAKTQWLILLLLLPVTGIGSFLLWRNDVSVAFDNHLMEGAQAGFLLLACLVHFYAARSQSQVGAVGFYTRIFLGFLCIAFAIREVDIDQLGEAPFWQALEQTVRTVVGSLFVFYLLYLLGRIPLFWREKVKLLHWSLVQLSLLGCVFYLLGWPFDKKLLADLSELQSQFIEEMFELWAALALFMASPRTKTHSMDTP